VSSTHDLVALFGIVGGPTALIATLITVWRARTDKQAVVMTTGETGVRLMDFVVERMERQVKRADETIVRLETALVAKDELIAKLQEQMRTKDDRIRSEQATYRRYIEEREETIRVQQQELRELHARLGE
jgi:predicted RNase H-like nuclease (RuvC/YqgF family)